MYYLVYFSCKDVPKDLYHPVTGLPEMDLATAKKTAKSLKSINLNFNWAYGPAFQDGIIKV